MSFERFSASPRPRHPEDVEGAVLVRGLRVRPALFMGDQPGAMLLKGVRNVLQEDEAQDDVLVLGGVHVVAELVRRLPELGLEAEHGAVGAVPPPAGLRIPSHKVPLKGLSWTASAFPPRSSGRKRRPTGPWPASTRSEEHTS